MKRIQCVHVLTACLVLARAVCGQQPADQQPPPAPAAAPPPPWSIGPFEFTGLIDGYVDKNFNNPASRFNGLRNFDVKSNQFSLNMAKLSIEHTPDPIGFRVDFGFGRAFEIIHGGEPDGPSVMRNIEQAYVSLKPPKGKGFQVDFGKFVTSAGAEVIETHLNWNYSRSLLFAWAIPYYHFGVRTSFPVGGHFTGGVQVVNGWNNVEDNNSGKTIGLTGAFTGKKVSWLHNYYAGPENADTSKGWRQLYDTTLLLTPSDAVNAYINFDYGQNKFADSGKAHWVGIAGAAKFSKGMFSVTPRLEYFNDVDGFSTGTIQKVKEFTLTGEVKLAKGFLTRLEYRHDWSDQAFFERGFMGTSKHQDTVLVGVVAFFGPK